MKRRDFLKSGVAAVATATITSLGAEGAEQGQSGQGQSVIKRYNQIGKTNLKMSDISFGTGSLPSASMVLRAVDRGINYFDTAPDYGRAEEHIGEAMKNLKRDKVIIASKFCNPQAYPAHLPVGSTKEQYVKAVQESLKRLKTDYLDICFVHAMGEVSKDAEAEKKRLLDDNMLSATESLKKAGKLRYLAVSSHGPTNMEDLLMAAVVSGKFDLIMPSFNFLKFPKLPDIIKEAAAKGVGVVAMKTLAGAKEMNLDFKTADFAQSAFKWVLKHPEVNGLVVTMKNLSDLDNYIPASGKDFTARDREVLNAYARLYGHSYCRTGCSQCEDACARGVEIANTLRYRMYFADYGMEKRAIVSYSALNVKADACLTCDMPTCTGACPYGLPVAQMLQAAHQSLTLYA
ncbi:oxidoreductase of aldo/keto reductase family [Candidatus Magnetobacterium bavaricum]|uniref:Oxidoreductase of aldo/keto reductase family n=1 Tax=Candidatus Magnetobacterium bavaricum TaxID=29290 RepID=A0A0F3GPT5_9BACT|nr:oxidoreductase of aldo/keto reductase family [Candidatus Magnetobacterium bavaricum]